MAARSDQSVTEEVKGILKKLGVQVNGLDFAGSAGGELPNTTITMDQAVVRLLAICAELLLNIRQGTQNP